MKEKDSVHRLLILLPALEYHLTNAEKIKKEIAKIKIKDLRRKK
jgi:hypothetical protein